MLILQPTSGEKTITIAPRTLFTNSFEGRVLSDNGIYEESTCLTVFQSRDYSMNIRRDGDGKEETITNLSISGISNFTNVIFNPTILEPMTWLNRIVPVELNLNYLKMMM